MDPGAVAGARVVQDLPPRVSSLGATCAAAIRVVASRAREAAFGQGRLTIVGTEVHNKAERAGERGSRRGAGSEPRPD